MALPFLGITQGSPWQQQNSYLVGGQTAKFVSPGSAYWGTDIGYVFGDSNFDDNVAVNGSLLFDLHTGAVNLAGGTSVDASLTNPGETGITVGLYPWQMYGDIVAYGGAEFSADGNLDNKTFTVSGGAEYGLLTKTGFPLVIGALPYASFTGEGTTFGLGVNVVIPLLNGVGLYGSVDRPFNGGGTTFDLGFTLNKPF